VVGYLLVAFVAFAAMGNAVLWTMKIRINRSPGTISKVSWWQKDFYARFEQISPESVLPVLARLSRWMCIGLLIAMIYFSLR
jgi:hypothetical protein